MPTMPSDPLHDDPMWNSLAPFSAKSFAQLLCVSAPTFWRGRRDGRYPQGVQLSTKRHAWTWREILSAVEASRGVVL